MRDETRRASEVLMAGIVAATFELMWLDLTRGGLMTLFGTVAIAGIVWVMLALRTLANGGPPEPEIDDGVMCMAAMAWAVVVMPPRAGNFLEQPTVDDFTWVWFPASVGVVFAMLAAQKAWPARTVRTLLARGVASLGLTSVLMAALLVLVAKGDGASALAMRGLVVAVVGGVVAWRLPAGNRR